MKRILFYISILGVFVACRQNELTINEDTTQITDTIPATLPNDNTNGDTTIVSDPTKTIIEKDYCYQIQAINEIGEIINAYDCMIFSDNYGDNLTDAYATLEPQIENKKQLLIDLYKNNPNYNSNDALIRKQTRAVANTPNDKLTFTAIDIYMYTPMYHNYTIVANFGIIDSEGNLYHLQTADD